MKKTIAVATRKIELVQGRPSPSVGFAAGAPLIFGIANLDVVAIDGLHSLADGLFIIGTFQDPGDACEVSVQ